MSDQTSSDARARDGSASDRKMTITQTAALTGAAASGVITLEFVFSCLRAHALLTPTTDQSIALLAVTGPFLHLLGRIVMYWTGRLLPKDA